MNGESVRSAEDDKRTPKGIGERHGIVSFLLRPAVLIPTCLAAAALVGILYLGRRNSNAREAVEERLAAIREKGEPATAVELAPPPLSDDENAAPLFYKAFDALVPCQECERAGITDWEDLLQYEGEPDMMLAKRALDLHSDAMAKARLALGRPKCRFEVDFAKGYQAELPHLAGLRHVARLFALEALVLSVEGRADEAARSCLATLDLARMLETEPILISQLVRIAITGIAIGSMRNCLQYVDFSDRDLLRIRQRLLDIDPVSISRNGFRGERVLLTETFEAMASGKIGLSAVSGTKETVQQRIQMAGKFVFLEDEAFALDVFRRVLVAIELPPHEAIPAVNAIFAEAEAEVSAHRMKHVLSGLLLPALGAAHTRAVRTWAHRDAAVIGLSCELFRSAKGRYPESLDDLAPEFLKEIPPDPFTGKPFRYELRESGRAFIVYSVGENLADDGGANDRAEKDDISWEGRAREE